MRAENRKYPVGRPPRRVGHMVIILSLILVISLPSGCGDEEVKTGTVGQGQSVGSLQKPEEGKVLLVDDLGDLTTLDGTTINASQWIDISQVSIEKNGEMLLFEMDVREPLPLKKPPGILGAEWGFLLNTNDDDEPDWGLYCSLPKADWSCGLYNMETKERFADEAFTGVVTHEGSKITWSLSPTAFSSEGTFKWVAYVDGARAAEGTSQSVDHAVDRAPNNGWPLGSWLDYP